MINQNNTLYNFIENGVKITEVEIIKLRKLINIIKNNIAEISQDTGVKESFVYLIKCNNVFKIGKSDDVKKRLSSMQTSNPELLICESYVKVKYPLEVEDALHSLFYNQRVRGEWFKLNDNHVELIKEFFYVFDEDNKGKDIVYRIFEKSIRETIDGKAVIKKINLHQYNNIKYDLLFWLKQWMITKVYSVKVKPIIEEKEKKVGKLVKEDVETNILNSKDIEEMRTHILLAKRQGLYNLPDNFNPLFKFYNFTIYSKKIDDIAEIDTNFTATYVYMVLAMNTPKTQELYYDQVKSFFKFIENNITDDFKFNIGFLRNGMKATSPIDKSQKHEKST